MGTLPSLFERFIKDEWVEKDIGRGLITSLAFIVSLGFVWEFREDGKEGLWGT